MENKTIYEMKLHESIEYKKLGFTTIYIIRVAGGWLYQTFRLDCNIMMSTFVPFDNEFQQI